MINHIQLKNFKCFEDMQLDLSYLTLITGVNGMGKSTIIQSLLLLRQSYDERYLNVDKKVLLKGELVNLISGDELRYSLANDPIINISVDFSSGNVIDLNINSGSSSNLLPVFGVPDEKIFQESLFQPTFCYLYADRLAPQELYSKTKASRHNGRLGPKNGELAASLLFTVADHNAMLPIKELKHPKAEDNNIYKNVSAWLSEIAYPGMQIRAEEATADTIKLNYLFGRGNSSSNVAYSPVSVAFGFSYVLPVILAILTAEPGSLLLIENPEAHLHPSAQSKMGMLLALAAQNGVQVVVETHSDHLLNGIRLMVKGSGAWGKMDENKILIHYFNSELNEDFDQHYKTTLKLNNSGKLDGWPNGFFDEWEKNLRSLIRS